MGHDHSHAHAAVDRPRTMAYAAALIGGFLIVEVVVGFLTGSLALLADAGHMLTDLFALVMGLIAVVLAQRGSRNPRRTFGWHRTEVLTALINAALLVGIAVFIVTEAIMRLSEPPEVQGWPMIVVAVVGLGVNVVVMRMLASDAEHSMAVRGAYLEVLADAVSSVGVLLAGIVMMTTGWRYADAIVAIAIAVWVLPRAVGLARDALRIVNQQSPQHLSVEQIRTELTGIAGVGDVHDLHIWSLTTGKDVATVHLTAAGSTEKVLHDALAILASHGLPHATVQVEPLARESQCRHDLHW